MASSTFHARYQEESVKSRQIADDLSERMVNIFKRDEDGRRPVFGNDEKLQKDEHFRDYIYFYEYFHGDNGAGIGASHQTGWTGLVAKLIQLFGMFDAKKLLEAGKEGAFTRGEAQK